MAFKIRAVVPIDKRDTLDAVQSLTVRLGPASKKSFGYSTSFVFGSSATLRERLAVARKGSVYRRFWELTETDQIQNLLEGDADFNHESVTDKDIKTIDSVIAFVLSAPANDFTLVAIDVSWSEDINDPYRAFQGVRSCLEGILWGRESRRMPQIPGFMLMSDPVIPNPAEKNEIPKMANRSELHGRLEVDTFAPALNSMIKAIPQVTQVHQIKNYRNVSLYMIPILFAQGQGLHTWAFCKIGMTDDTNLMPPGEDLQPATTAWEFGSFTSWQFLCILNYWLSQSMLSLAQVRDQTLNAVKMHTYRQEDSEYRELLDKQSNLSQRLLILGNLEDWVPDLSTRAQEFLINSNRLCLQDRVLNLPGQKQEASDFAMQIPLEIKESLHDISEMTKSLQAHVAEYVSVATMKQQYELMEQGRRTNSIIVWLTVAVIVLALVQATPSVEKWVRGSTMNENAQQVTPADAKSDAAEFKRYISSSALY